MKNGEIMRDEYRGKDGIVKILAAQDPCSVCTGENFHPGYGCDVVKLTKDDIVRLLAGEPLWFDDGEYSHILIAER